MPLKSLLDTIGPGDGLFVRCGGLAHYTTVWKVDKAGGKLYLHDDLFEFWMPSHNDCISAYDLVPLMAGRYLVELSISDVAPVIEAVETTRDFISQNGEDIERYLKSQKGLIWIRSDFCWPQD